MAWIESHQTLGQHPKTRRLARYLGISLPAAVGHLHYLWWWTLDYAQNGDLSRYEIEDIADAALWDGDAKSFVEALVKSGFLDLTDEGLCIHDWDDYAGRLIDKRKANSERARKWREKKNNERETNAFVMHNERATNDATVPNLTVPNHTKPENNNLPCASPDDDAREITDVVSADFAGHDPVSVEAETVTATGEQQAAQEQAQEQEQQKADKPRTPFTSKRQEQMFDRFWELYPRKKSKGQAEKVWARLRPNDELFASILTGLERAKASYDWQKEGGKYIPYPATWLNAKGWEDEYTPAVPRAAPVTTQTQAQERRRRLPAYIVEQLEAERAREV